MKNKIRFTLMFFTVSLFSAVSYESLADEYEPDLFIIEMMPDQPVDTLVVPENKTPALFNMEAPYHLFTCEMWCSVTTGSLEHSGERIDLVAVQQLKNKTVIALLIDGGSWEYIQVVSENISLHGSSLYLAKTERSKLSEGENVVNKTEDVADIIFEPPTPSKFHWL